MREATLAEYNEATAQPWLDKRTFPGKVVTTVEWTLRGKPVASKVESSYRGKVRHVTYYVASPPKGEQ